MAHQVPVRFDQVMRPRDLSHQVIKGLDPDVIGIEGEDSGGRSLLDALPAECADLCRLRRDQIKLRDHAIAGLDGQIADRAGRWRRELAVKDLDPQVLTIILARESLAPLANR